MLEVAKEAYALYQSENALGPAAFPSLKRMETEVIAMAIDLLNGPVEGTGNITSGGTESIILAVKTCRDEAASRGVDVIGANLVLPRTAHLAFDKAAHYLGLEIRRVDVDDDFLADPAAMAEAMDDRTLMIMGSAPCFPYGLVDPIPALSDLALERNVWLHVDACVGGYLNPFAEREGVELPAWDFRVEGVRTISADLHKYGYAAKGASTILHRSAEQHAHQTFSNSDWPAGAMTTPTVAGTRPGGAIASAWAVMNYLGVDGYREKHRQVTEAREAIETGVRQLGFEILGKPLLGIVAFSHPELNVFAIYKQMYGKGWFTSLTTSPRALHLMLSPFHREVTDTYLADLEASIAAVRAGDTDAVTEARYS